MNLYILIIALLLACFGCDMLSSAPPSATSTTVPETVSTDLTALNQLLTLEEAPQSVQWVETTLGTASDRVPGPTDRAIIAVLTYAQAPRWPQALKRVGGDLTVSSDFIRSWFPEPVKAAFVDNRLTVPRYDAAPIGVSPYLNGYVFAVEQYVFVYLFTT